MNIEDFKNLNPAKNNYGFTIEVLSQVFLEKLKQPISNTNLFTALSGAKGFGKTYLVCLLALFFTSNFEDFNAQLAKYEYNNARASYSKTMTKVINHLAELGVTLKNALENPKSKLNHFNSENRCEWVFPNGRTIQVIGFDNSAKWEGVPAAIGDWGFFGIDEVIPIDKPIVDEEEYIYKLLNIIIQLVRGKNMSYSTKALSELKINSWQLYKKHMAFFCFNNHDMDHPIYQLFCENISPLTEAVKKELEENDISFRENKQFLNVGATVIRGTTNINKHNLSDKLTDLEIGIKQDFPQIHQTLFKGAENELMAEKYSYRKDLIANAKFFDSKQFFWPKLNKYWFDDVVIGIDYADGGATGDDALVIVSGLEIDKNNIVDGIYVLKELSINTKSFKDMTNKVHHIADFLNSVSKKYILGPTQILLANKMKTKIGHDSRTVKDFLIKILLESFSFDENIKNTFRTFKATGSKRWSIENRHYIIKRLLNEGKIYFSKDLAVSKVVNGENVTIKKYGHLYSEMYRCLNHPDKKIRDERPKKNKLDAINAFEHGISWYRFCLFQK